MKRQEIPDGTEIANWYVRTVRTGPFVFVAGTTSLDPKGKIVGKTAEEQTHATMKKIGRALKSAGSSFEDVTRLTIYITDLRDGPAVTKALSTYFKKSRCASALIGTTALAVQGLLVEIETTAVICDEK
jgi:2-iminobutanoate/2-iminopropanoate deaminase